MRLAFFASLLFLAVLTTPGAGAQNVWTDDVLPFAVTVEGSLGGSTVRWEDRTFRRWSYLPEATLAVGASRTFGEKVIVEPKLGLHFYGVSLHSLDGYRDRYHVTSVRTGLFVMAMSDSTKWNRNLVVGLGLEAWRPLHVRGRAYGRTADGRAWAWVPDPPGLDGWEWYWTFRIGLRHIRWTTYFDVCGDNGDRFLPALFVPNNPLAYLSLRFGFQRRL